MHKLAAGRIEDGYASSREPFGVQRVVWSVVLPVEHPTLSRCRTLKVSSPREVKSVTSGKAELALPTLAIAEVPVSELPVADRLLLWENSQLVKPRVQPEATRKHEDTNDAAQPEEKDACARGIWIGK